MVLSIYDIAYNPLDGGVSMTMTGFQTRDTRDKTLGLDMYRFLVNSIRMEDQKNDLFLQRYLQGPQLIWEQIQNKINELETLYDPIEVDERWLKYLKWSVGWTDDIDTITPKLETDQLRRLIRSSVALWKKRGGEQAIIDLLTLTTGARMKILNWFDSRWILEETQFGEEMDGVDSWLLDSPGVESSEYWSNLRIVDDGELDRDLVKDAVKLMRSVSERFTITYLLLLDQFTVEGDDSQWALVFGSEMEVTNGTMIIASGGVAVCINENALGWDNLSHTARIKSGSTGGILYCGTYMNWDELGMGPTSYIVFGLDINNQQWGIFHSSFGAIAGDVLPYQVYPEVYYTMRLKVTQFTYEGDDYHFAEVYLDGDKLGDAVVPKAILAGSVGMGGDSPGITISEAETYSIPTESDTIEINS